MEIEIQVVTYDDVKRGVIVNGDNHNFYKEGFERKRKSVLLNNPNLSDYSFSAAYLVRAEAEVVGALFPFPTRIKVGEEIIDAASASSLNVLKEYEKHAAGADLVLAPIRDKRNKGVVLADLSEDGLNCYQAFRFKVFALPKMIQPRSSKFLLQNFGIKGFSLSALSCIINVLLKPFISISLYRLRNFAKRFNVVRLDVVPSWVDDMVLKDGHKYMEVHDHRWLQWCLDNTFSSENFHHKSFYAIYDNNERPIGFFLNYEKTTSIPYRHIFDLRQGTIMEWGSYDESKLSELDITKIAISFFSKDLAMCQFATTNKVVLNKMKSYGFIHHNYHHIVFKDNTKMLKDCGDSNLWRLRFGYADSLF